MTEQVTIPARFNGPPASANGGYACGLVAEAIGPCATVRLSAPPPLGVPLTRRRGEDGAVLLLHGDITVAEGRPARPPDEGREPPSWAAAARAEPPEHHPYPSCFVCGPLREADGLRVFVGPAGDGGLVAGTWRPEDADPRLVWAALDCPSGFACIPPGTLTVLATMTAALEAPVHAGRDYIVAAWPIASEGRKHRAGSALYERDGRRVALAETLWITPKSR